MQFNVAQLLKEPTGSIRRYELTEAISELDDELEILGPLVGVLTLLRTNSGVLATGELSTAVQVTCSRCEEPIALQVRFNLEEVFHPTTEVHTGRTLRPDEYEGEIDELDDAALLIDDKHILDMTEVIRQDIWLSLPMYPGCNWDGPGQCPNLISRLQSLEDVRLLQFGDSGREPEAVDPRWAPLLDLEKASNRSNE